MIIEVFKIKCNEIYINNSNGIRGILCNNKKIFFFIKGSIVMYG